jgi:aquaporin Z
MKQWQKYLAEVLGTFTLVFGGSLAILSGGDIVSIAFGFGLALLAGLYAFGEVSGGHFNPILTLAAFLDRRISALETIWYWIAQFVGAILASLVILVSYASSSKVGDTANRPIGGTSDARAFVFEIVIAAIFVAVFLQVTRSSSFSGQTLLAIPLTLAALHLATIGITSTGANPARSFAPTLLSGDHWSTIWIYILAPPIGAVIGWAAHMVAVRGDTSLKDELKTAASDMRGVDMSDLKEGPLDNPPASQPGA